MATAQSSWKPYNNPSAKRSTVEGTARMESGQLVIWNPLTGSNRPTFIRRSSHFTSIHVHIWVWQTSRVCVSGTT
jgi:hypothetical protein